MKRDLDLVRCILSTVESADGPVDTGVLLGCCGDIKVLAFHVELMRSHGLLAASVYRSGFGEPMDVTVDGLTCEGYDYLDSIRSPQVWEKAKEVIGKSIGDTSLSVVKVVCGMVATQLVRRQLGM